MSAANEQKSSAMPAPIPDDYYELLALSRQEEADSASIRRAYRRQALIWHPDKSTDPSRKQEFEERFKAISEAYQVLSDPTKKDTYDRFGKDALHGHPTGPGGFSGFPGGFSGFPGGFSGFPGPGGFSGFTSSSSGGPTFFYSSSGGGAPPGFANFFGPQPGGFGPQHGGFGPQPGGFGGQNSPFMDPFEMFRSSFGQNDPFAQMQGMRAQNPAMDEDEMIRQAVDESMKEHREKVQPQGMDEDQALEEALRASMAQEDRELAEAIAASIAVH